MDNTSSCLPSLLTFAYGCFPFQCPSRSCRLRKRQLHLKVGLISDCAVEVQLHWPNTSFAHLIDISILSCAVKVKKPDARIYQLACEQLNAHPQHCLYIGDGSSHELTGVANVGIHPVLLAGYEERNEDAIRPDAEAWQGPSISLFTEVLKLI